MVEHLSSASQEGARFPGTNRLQGSIYVERQAETIDPSTFIHRNFDVLKDGIIIHNTFQSNPDATIMLIQNADVPRVGLRVVEIPGFKMESDKGFNGKISVCQVETASGTPIALTLGKNKAEDLSRYLTHEQQSN